MRVLAALWRSSSSVVDLELPLVMQYPLVHDNGLLSDTPILQD